ncbi:MAG: hypothetical protein Q4C56_04645 [Peptococcaceae bacterium]|nr:hypothetical protein [Peptococcaceae bacterium]
MSYNGLQDFFEMFFSNIGGKIKLLAKIELVLYLICSALYFLLWIFDKLTGADIFDGILEMPLLFSIAMFFGGIASSWITYAFGQIVEDIHALRQGDNQIVSINSSPGYTAPRFDDLPRL